MDYFVVRITQSRPNIQVMGCWYRQTLVRVVISRPFVSLSLFGGGGGGGSKKYFIFIVLE